MDCPTCGQPIGSGQEAAEIRRDWKHSMHRTRAAEEVAEAVWWATEKLLDFLESKDDERSEDGIRDAFSQLVGARQTFLEARSSAEAATGERPQRGWGP